ncbi:reverse transcriptase domain-containing protein [Tanacetum coccineum]
MGIAEDVVVRVDGFTFLTDFVVVNFEPDSRVPIILERPFLRTAKALIDLYEEKINIKNEPFSGSTTNHSDALSHSSPVKTSDNLEEFADELTLLKKGVHKENFQVYSNPLFEFDDDFNSSNENPLFNEIDEDVENKNSNVLDSDKPVLFNTPSSDKVECSDPEDDIDEIDAFLAMEFAGELITLPSRIVREHTDYLSRMTLLCEISTFRSHDNVHANSSSIIEYLPVSLIPVEDSDPVQEEIDIFQHSDDLISTSDNPSSPHPSLEPPDVCFNIEPDTAMKNDEDYNQGEIVLSLNVEDVNSFTFVIWTFLPFFTYPEDSRIILSLRSEDLDEPKFSEDSRVRCFVPEPHSIVLKRQEEEKRIAEEKEAAAKCKIQECLNIEEKSIPQASTHSRKFRIDLTLNSLESSVKDPIPIPSESNDTSNGAWNSLLNNENFQKALNNWCNLAQKNSMLSIYDENNKIRDCYKLSPFAITPVLPTDEDSLIMGDEPLSTIPEKESDELIKSSVENLVPIPS